MPADFKKMYEQKSTELEQINGQFNEMQEEMSHIINDLENQNKELKRINQLQIREITDLKEKRKYFNSTVEREIEHATKERSEFKKKFLQFQKKVIELQIVNESLESELRATKSDLANYEERIEKTMEQLALLQIQMEESTSTNKQQNARLKAQLKQTQEELFALHHNKSKREFGEDRRKDEHSVIPTSESVLGQRTMLNINPNGSLFKDCLKDIRDYIGSIDEKKKEIRRLVLRNI